MSTDKIVGLFSRLPVQPESLAQKPEPETKSRVDQHAVELLELALERAKVGDILGVIVLSGVPDGHNGVSWVAPAFAESIWEFDQNFIGGLHAAAYDILRISDADLLSADDG